MESDEDATMDDLLNATFSAMEDRRGSEELESGEEDDEVEVEEEEVEVEVEGRVDDELCVAIEEGMDAMTGLAAKLQGGGREPGRDEGDIAEVSELARGVEAKLEELERSSSPDRMVSASHLRVRFREIVSQVQALEGRVVVGEEKDSVQRRSDGNQKRRRVVVGAELSTVPAETGADGMCPPHPGYMWGVCFRCGEKKSTVPNNDAVQDRVGLRYIHEGLEVSELEASRVRNSELRRVTGKQKLLLVVDLDHTMLNSARFLEIPVEERTYLSTAYHGPNANNSNEANVGQQQGNVSSLYQLSSLGMWTKLRPFAHRFLEEASKLCEMYVYTMGERAYALAMAKLLDPTGQLFGDRIISQTDSTKRHTKDLDVVLGAESAVVILDDTEVVWPNHRSNLILMERYHFFTSSCNQFRLRTPSLARLHRDESEMDGTLANTLQTLKSIHHEFFNGQRGKNLKRRPIQESPDVREIIRSIRAKLLAGCNIVFSRVFPTGLQNPEGHPLWQLAVELGARCKTTCDRLTTHVVAFDRGTDKARWAKQHGIYLVHPRWVEAASFLWCHPIEGEYPVTEDASAQTVATFSKSVLVEPVIIDVEPLIDPQSGSAEDTPVVESIPDKTEPEPSVDNMGPEEDQNIASRTGNPEEDSGVNSPDCAAEGSLTTSVSGDVK